MDLGKRQSRYIDASFTGEVGIEDAECSIEQPK
jgi:hypothetical protein